MDFETKKPAPSFFFSTRFLLSIVFFFGAALQYAHKADISVGIVCMVNHTAVNPQTNHSNLRPDYDDDMNCLFKPSENRTIDRDGPFNWSRSIQEHILSAYFYGYLITQIPGGWLSYKFGPKRVFIVSMLFGSIGTILVPVFARWHYMALFFCRFVTGLAQGVMWPTMMGTWSKWAPPNERSSLLGFSNSGSHIGTIIGFSYGGFLCQNGFDGGWPSIFYIFGIAGLLWCVFCYFLMYDTPHVHRFISEKEKLYILEETKHSNKISKSKMPWKEILTSKSCIALFISHFSAAWIVILFMTNLPIYMKEILKFDVKSNGLMSSLPSALYVIVVLAASTLSDKLIKTNTMKRHRVRQLFNALGFLLPGVAMIAISFVTCGKPYLGVAISAVGFAFHGFVAGGGFVISYTDIAGSYSGFLFGISNTLASITGIVVPPLIAAITKNQLQSEWMIVFWITAAINFVGAIASIFFTTSELQNWAIEREQNEYEQIQ